MLDTLSVVYLNVFRSIREENKEKSDCDENMD